MAGKNLFLVLYTTVSLVCVLISVYLSYYGYYAHFQQITIFFSILLGLLLFGADMLIRQVRLTNRSLLFPLLFFSVIALFSGASNFNYLYSEFMAEDIATRDIERVFNTYRHDLTTTRETLLANPTVAQAVDTRNALDRELQNLLQQITDPNRPGCGRRCKSHMRQINDILGGSPTQLKIPNPQAPQQEQREWFKKYKTTVIQDYEQGAAPQKYRDAMRVIKEIDALLDKYSNPHKALREKGSIGATTFLGPNALDLPQTLRRTSYDIERQANAILSDRNHVDHTDIRSEMDTIGEIPTSITDGFVSMPSPGVTLVSLLLAIFVDIAPILFAFVLFSPEVRAAQGPENKTSRSTRVKTR